MSDELRRCLLSSEPLAAIVRDRLIRALESHPEVLAERREYEAWERRVIEGDPSAPQPEGIIRA